MRDLKRMLKNALVFGDFTLASGKHSDYYLDVRKISLSTVGAKKIGELFWEFFGEDQEIDYVGGLEVGAVPIITAILMTAPGPIKGFVVRKTEKKHGLGTDNWFLGDVPKGKVVLVDDVTTTGSSFKTCLEKMEKSKCQCEVIMDFAVVDRGNGDHGISSLFTIEELLV